MISFFGLRPHFFIRFFYSNIMSIFSQFCESGLLLNLTINYQDTSENETEEVSISDIIVITL